MNPHRADLDLGHPPRVGAEEEDVAGGRLDGEVLVHRAHGHPVGVEHHAVVTGLGDGAAAGQRRQPRPAARPQPAVDRVVVQVSPPPPAARLDAPAHQRDHVVEVLAGQLGVRRGPPGHRPERFDLTLVGGGHLGHQLLGQHVEGRHRRFEQVEPPLAHRRQEGGAFDELVPRRRVETAGRRAVPVVVRPAHALEERADGARRADLAHQFDRTDVDPEFERRRRHQRAEVPGAQPRLDDAAPGRRQAAVVRRHEERRVHVPAAPRIFAVESFGQLMGHPLGHLPRVDEDQGRAVMPGVLGDVVEDVGHLATAHHRLELGRRQLDRHFEVAGVAAVDDHRRGAVRVHAREQPGHQVQRLLRGRKPDALHPAAALGHQRVEPLEARARGDCPACRGPTCALRRRSPCARRAAARATTVRSRAGRAIRAW